MNKKFDARVFRLGHDISLEKIMPCRYPPLGEAPEALDNLFDGGDSGVARKFKKGDIIVAGRNFGWGDSPGHAVSGLKGADVPCIIAESFSRPFYRQAINHGLPLFESSEAFERIADGETIEIDLEKREITHRKGKIGFPEIPEIIMKIISAGGLIPYTRKQIGK